MADKKVREMTCITCPNGCELHVEECNGKITVTGNQCKRGEQFAISELKTPVRTICSTVRTVYQEVPVLPVRVTKEIPKERLFDVMKEINKIVITKPEARGNVLIKDVLGLGADVIVTSNVLYEAIGEGGNRR